jgi:esterase/lipase superfamily enzyme
MTKCQVAASLAIAVAALVIPWHVARADRAAEWDACRSYTATGEAIKACSVIVQDGAETRFDRSIAYMNRALAYKQAQQVDLAIADYSKAIELQPNFALAFIRRGALYVETGKYDLAIQDLTQALQLEPNSLDAYRYRAQAYRAKGLTSSAEDDEKRLPSPRSSSSSAASRIGPPTGPDPTTAFTAVPLLFGTDRDETKGPGAAPRIQFSSGRTHKLTLGRAIITVPKSHTVTQVERPWTLTILKTTFGPKEDPASHFTVQKIDVLTKDDFARIARTNPANKLFQGHALVFVHGFNVTFDNALYRAAQIVYDLQFDGPAFLYSWPSVGDPASYLYDRDSAKQSVPLFQEFIELVADTLPGMRVSVVAHSMGGALLLDVLDVLRRERPQLQINEIVLAAPDIDTDVFRSLSVRIAGISKGLTMYASGNDIALKISGAAARGTRAGEVPPTGPLVLKGVDTIDATALGTDFMNWNHSGYADKTALLNDVSLLIKKGEHPPDQRVGILRKIDTPLGPYWKFP